MVLFGFIFPILIAPIKWLANLLTRPKTNLLEWHLFYGPYFVKIQTIHKGKSLSDDLLIASYIMFLARYFYICDDRQADVARHFLLDFIRRAQDPNGMTGKLYEAIFKTLNPAEQDAAIKFFKIHSRFASVPPLTYSEDKELSHSYAKYSFYIIKSDRPASIFDMSAGPDVILLPVTVGILYKYVVDKIQDKNKKEKLDQSIIDFLEACNTVDWRSQDGLTRLELLEKIILKYGLKWK